MGQRSAPRGLGYRLRFRALNLGARIYQVVAPRIPAAWFEALWEVVWRIAYRLQRARTRRMEAAVGLVLADRFPDAAERRAVVRRSWRHLYRSVLEAALAGTHPAERERLWRLPVTGAERLRRAFDQGRGVVVVSAHIGAFTAVPIRLAADYPVSLVANRPDDDRAAALLDGVRAVAGMESVPVRPAHAAARASLAALRRGRVVTILADVFRSGGVEVRFLGRPASAARGPASLALRTGAPVIPVFALRDAEDRACLRVGPEIELLRTGNPVEEVAVNTQRICDVIEEQIRERPDQWHWGNFRSTPRTAARKFRPREQTGDVDRAGGVRS